jgi:hypothetical protein
MNDSTSIHEKSWKSSKVVLKRVDSDNTEFQTVKIGLFHYEFIPDVQVISNREQQLLNNHEIWRSNTYFRNRSTNSLNSGISMENKIKDFIYIYNPRLSYYDRENKLRQFEAEHSAILQGLSLEALFIMGVSIQIYRLRSRQKPYCVVLLHYGPRTENIEEFISPLDLFPRCKPLIDNLTLTNNGSLFLKNPEKLIKYGIRLSSKALYSLGKFHISTKHSSIPKANSSIISATQPIGKKTISKKKQIQAGYIGSYRDNRYGVKLHHNSGMLHLSYGSLTSKKSFIRSYLSISENLYELKAIHNDMCVYIGDLSLDCKSVNLSDLRLGLFDIRDSEKAKSLKLVSSVLDTLFGDKMQPSAGIMMKLIEDFQKLDKKEFNNIQTVERFLELLKQSLLHISIYSEITHIAKIYYLWNQFSLNAVLNPGDNSGILTDSTLLHIQTERYSLVKISCVIFMLMIYSQLQKRTLRLVVDNIHLANYLMHPNLLEIFDMINKNDTISVLLVHPKLKCSSPEIITVQTDIPDNPWKLQLNLDNGTIIPLYLEGGEKV